MDISSPGNLTLFMILGTIGLVVLRIGWKERQLPQLILGSAMMMLPYVVYGSMARIVGACLLLGVLKVATRL